MRSRKKKASHINILISILTVVIVLIVVLVKSTYKNVLTNDEEAETVTKPSVEISKDILDKFDKSAKYDVVNTNSYGVFDENDIDYKKRYKYDNLEYFYQYQEFINNLTAGNSEILIEDTTRYVDSILDGTYFIGNYDRDVLYGKHNFEDKLIDDTDYEDEKDVNYLFYKLSNTDLSIYKNIVIWNLYDDSEDCEKILYNYKTVSSIIYDRNPQCKIFVMSSSLDNELNILLKENFKGQYIDVSNFKFENVVSSKIISNYVGFYIKFLELKNNSFEAIDRITEDDIVYGDKKELYITFDDGPSSYTNILLDILDKNDVKATFFVTHNYSDFEDTIKKEKEAGHTVGAHTYTHNYKIYKSKETYFEDLYKMQYVVRKQTGDFAKLIRFPGGSVNTSSKKYNDGIMEELVEDVQDMGYVYYDWNVSSGDGNETTRDMTLTRAKNGLNSRYKKHIVLFHDIKKTTVEAIDEFIKYAKDKGFEILPLEDNSYICHQKFK